jgi:hypothetical protein
LKKKSEPKRKPVNRIKEFTAAKLAGKRLAAKLTKLTGGKVKFEYVPESYLPDDPDGSRGHLYAGCIADLCDDEIVLDDRGPDSMSVQMFEQLHRIARFYSDIASAVEAAAVEGGEL